MGALDSLTRDLRGGDRAGLLRACRRAYLLALATLAVPGLPLGLLLAAVRPLTLGSVGGVLAATVLAAVLAGVAAYLARRSARDEQLSASQAALTGAIQAATAPGVPFLIGCAFLGSGAALLPLWGVALLAHALVWWQFPGWLRPAQAPAT
ncbi:hypothetical protein GCM10008959_10930 [Deinococcus seoulensis]|uniref:MFS transporter n=1 Tax=Deinococcus seoulensis TaxID=1837379 RepID=A0ABQ2RS94_9DEIO|nr:hypothetical protein [Deinococcus seoulensis]GGR51488.1 hypothetical protein GCM10008959_10930 [Deinococcus seoulensis]